MLAQNNDHDELHYVDAINWVVGTQTMAAAIGQAGIEKMQYHYPLGSGDHHYVDIYMADGVVSRIFNPSQIIFKDPNYEKGSYDTERADGCKDQTVEDSGSGPDKDTE